MMGAGSALHSGAFGQDSDLRRWGLKLAEREGKMPVSEPVVAVGES